MAAGPSLPAGRRASSPVRPPPRRSRRLLAVRASMPPCPLPLHLPLALLSLAGSGPAPSASAPPPPDPPLPLPPRPHLAVLRVVGPSLFHGRSLSPPPCQLHLSSTGTSAQAWESGGAASARARRTVRERQWQAGSEKRCGVRRCGRGVGACGREAGRQSREMVEWNLVAFRRGIGGLTNLNYLNLLANNLSGVVSEEHFANLSSLTSITLSANYLLEIKMDLNWVPPFQLKWASFGLCHVGPQFPSWLRSQKDIVYLDMSSANLTGMIPNWFWTTFSKTRVLFLSNNTLEGELPPNLEFMSVQLLALGSNRLTGSVPRLPRSIKVFDFSRNSLNKIILSITGVIPEHVCQWKQLQVLDLSSNLLLGELPDCGIKDLKRGNSSSVNSSMALSNAVSPSSLNIRTLLLSRNNLSDTIGTLRSLESLDLSNNQLDGEIPLALSNLTSLSYLNLSYNNLSGRIPSGRQLDTLDMYDYIGNPGLCGSPLPKKCLDISQPQ
ncbi:hypothetical protein U9M48_040965 [Paspalum notatum var. saurae]|uniref:Leucine-rich repeat-containing N-terminal plant-type domain-containing protein n=1 Tax=Paspalum notatum var. saurae TaxID=547442 RepID=A0AAQ3URN2_PASNO